MIYLLDTNVLPSLRRPDRAPQVARWLDGKPDDSLFLSVITLGGIERGIALQDPHNLVFARDLQAWLDRTTQLYAERILPFDAPAARICGQLSARIGTSGADLQIAATALARDATVVTGDPAFLATGARVLSPFPDRPGR